jgi:hypothetical protein
MLGNLFTGLLSKILLATTLVFLSVASISTYLYLGTRDELTLLKSTYTQLKQDYTECSESKSKIVEGGKQDDTLNVEKETDISTLEGEKKSLLKRLDILSKKRCITTTTTLEKLPDEKTYIDPSASWDVDIQQLLNEAYENNKRDTNPTP